MSAINELMKLSRDVNHVKRNKGNNSKCRMKDAEIS